MIRVKYSWIVFIRKILSIITTINYICESYSIMIIKNLKLICFYFCLLLTVTAQAAVVNDVTGMTPVKVKTVVQPKSTQQVAELVQKTSGPISIAGGKYSMGGQTAFAGAIQIDTSQLNHVIAFNPEKKLLTIEAGATCSKCNN